MFLRFTVKNFRSIREQQEVSLVAVPTRIDELSNQLMPSVSEGVSGLRTVGFFGANASGKSNVLRAMRSFSDIVRNSHRKWEPTSGVPAWDPFLLDRDSSEHQTEFEIDFQFRDALLSYGFCFDRNSIVEEWLIDKTSKRKTLFQRKTLEGIVRVRFPNKNLTASSENSKLLELVKLQTRPNSLFLSCAAQGNHEFLSAVFTWIVSRFYILSPYSSPLRSYTASKCTDGELKQSIETLLVAADVGISGVAVSQKEEDAQTKRMFSKIMGVLKEMAPTASLTEDAYPLRHTITMFHQGQNGETYPLPFEQESAGTKAFFEMLGPILVELSEGSVLLIDEIESSLHPSITRLIVQLFNDPEINARGAQLIFTTHDITLLDLNVMRRDQFSLVAKNEEGSTQVSSLADFKPRAGQDVALAYLHGRFGSVPYIDAGLVRNAVVQAVEHLSGGSNA